MRLRWAADLLFSFVAMRDAKPGIDLAVVSFFNAADFLGGAERVAWAEAELMSRTQNVVFVSASPPSGGAPFPQLRVGGWTRSLFKPKGRRRNPIALVVFHLLSLFNPFVFLESLALFRRIRPAVVHTHILIGLSPAIWLSARLSGARVLHTHHDLWLECERATMTDDDGRPCNESQPACGICKAVRPVKKVQARAVSAEIFPSDWVRARLGRRGSVIRGFSTSRFAERERIVPDGPATVVFVGALTAQKLGVLLEGFERASASGGPAMELVIAGAGPLEASIAALADSDSNVSYLGLIDSEARDRLLERASVVVIPSTCPETSSLVFFEALAAGVPVIASDIGGLTELERFGNLVLVPPGDADELARALVGLLADAERLAHLRQEALRHRDAASPERFAADTARALAALHGAEGVDGSGLR